jgi:hypothetical protein
VQPQPEMRVVANQVCNARIVEEKKAHEAKIFHTLNILHRLEAALYFLYFFIQHGTVIFMK